MKEVEFGTVEASELRVKPNLPRARAAARQGARRRCAQALAAGEFEELDGGRFRVAGHELEPDEVLVERVGLDGWAVASEDGVTVALDTALDDELRLEARVYDLIREVQNLRKDERPRDHRPHPALDPGRRAAAVRGADRGGDARRLGRARRRAAPREGVRRLAAALGALVLAPAALGAYGTAQRAGTITSPELTEVSGLTAATVVRGGWWVLNDSGNTPELHLISGKGKLLQTVRVSGASNVDWEDLASAPGANGRRTLYVGDIGDNDAVRDDLVVYRVPEPSRGARTRAADGVPVPLPRRPPQRRGALRRPGVGAHLRADEDAEPRGRADRALPLPAAAAPGHARDAREGRRPLREARRAAAAQTGAAVSPDGTRLAIRTYTDAWEWHRRPGSSFASIFAAPFEHVVLAARAPGRVDRLHGRRQGARHDK